MLILLDAILLSLEAMVALYGLGALAALVAGDRGPRGLVPVYGLAVGGGLAGIAAALPGLAGGPAWVLALPATLPFGQGQVRLDGLASVFLLLISAGAVVASVYALGYLRHEALHRHLRAMGACFHLFLLAMAGVVLADDGVTFIIAWETMSLASLGLVLEGQGGQEGKRAGVVYIATMHIGTGFILGALLLSVQHAGAWGFDAFRLAGASMPEPARSLAFLFALLGFGTKAGLVPLHGWLPLAHPAAPSHVSALMSGVMVKLGVLMFLRFAFEFLGPPEVSWGTLVLGLGLATGLVGVLFALVERDLKRLLAFSTIENVGIIFAALGTALLLLAWDHRALAALAAAAALFHVVNHMAFKGLLFLGTGAVVEAAGTRDLERLGGLAKRMPLTAGLFLVGVLAISAVPPFNGFASEWMVFQSFLGLLQGHADGAFLGGLVVAAAAVLALGTGLVGAAMVRAYGGVFCGLPRSDAAAAAHDPPWSMRASMAALAAACVVLGLGAGYVGPAVAGVGARLVATHQLPVTPGALPGLATLQPLAVAALLVVGLAVAVLASSRSQRPSRVPPWTCGEVKPAPRFLLSPTAFGATVSMVFANVLRPSQEVRAEGEHAPYAPSRLTASTTHEDLFSTRLYAPVPRFLRFASTRLRVIQSGSLHLYVAYVLLACLVTLVVVAWR